MQPWAPVGFFAGLSNKGGGLKNESPSGVKGQFPRCGLKGLEANAPEADDIVLK